MYVLQRSISKRFDEEMCFLKGVVQTRQLQKVFDKLDPMGVTHDDKAMPEVVEFFDQTLYGAMLSRTSLTILFM
jgi:hypothetical protein